MRPFSPISPPSAEPPPLFDERRPKEYRNWALPLFLLVSLLVHSLGFYTFHVVYPTPQDVQMPTATLNLVTIPAPGQDTATGSQPLLAGWLRDSDPALLATWRAMPPDWFKLERGNYVPLFERWKLQPALAPLVTPFTERSTAMAASVPAAEWDWRLGQTPLDLDPAWLGMEAAGTTKAIIGEDAGTPATSIQIAPLAAEEAQNAPSAVAAPSPEQLNLPPFHAGGESVGTVQNAEYLLGADIRGQVLFTLTRRGSNSGDLDAATERYLRALKLPKPSGAAGSGLSWWRARFTWGREVFDQP